MEGLRERKRAASRAATVDAALALFGERGFDDVTVADVCDAAQIAPRTFFRYFASKDELLAEPVRQMTARTEASIAACPPTMLAPHVVQVALMEVGAYAVEHRARLAAFRAVLRGTRSGTAMSATLPESERRLADLVAAHRSPGSTADWRGRLLVATAVAGFRVWLEDLLADAPEATRDPLGHLHGVLAAALPGPPA